MIAFRNTHCMWCGKTTKHTTVNYNSGIGTCTECGHVRNPDSQSENSGKLGGKDGIK